jgi:DNA repair protein RadD
VIPVNLYDYQQQAVEAIRAGIRAGHQRQVLMSPTGSGKTEIATSILQGCYGKGSRALFIVDRIVLADQTSARFDQYELPHGVIQAGHWRTRLHETIQVCSAQTIERRGIPEGVSFVFVDEGHSLRKEIVQYLMQTKAIVVCLTATPFTKGMKAVYSNLINVATTNELTKRGFLVPLKVYAARPVDTTGLKVVAGEWKDSDLSKRALEIVGDVVAEWEEKTFHYFGGPVKTLCFSVTVDDGAAMCERYRAAGYNFHQISYKDGSPAKRKEIIDEFSRPNSEIHGLISCEVFTKGFDCRDVMIGVSARPYRKNLAGHIQQLGRPMRTFPGKSFGVWLCHSNNYLRFQEDTERIFEHGMSELDDGLLQSKTRKEPTEKERKECKCPNCGLVMKVASNVCPNCKAKRTPKSVVKHKEGEMFAVDSRASAEAELAQKKAFYAGLLTYGQEKGYKDGWAANQFKEKFKDWPNHPSIRNVAPGPVPIEVKNHLLSKNIRRAKGKKKRPE